MLFTLYDVTISTINEHITTIYKDFELTKEATIRKFPMVQNEGRRKIKRIINHYNLQMIISIGFKVNNEKAVQFRKWANSILKEYTIKGFALDDDRLKNNGSILTEKYFEELLERIREIRLSERKLYQKITDIYATSIDYDKNSKITQTFFKTVQNKLHYSIHGQTVSEVIYNRVDSNKVNLGLTTWEGAPNSKIHRYDIVVAKNYLTDDELHQLRRVVSAYLDLAENKANKHIPMTMKDWEERLNKFLELLDRDILKDAGKISRQIASDKALTEYEKYRIKQDCLYRSDFDLLIEEAKNIDE